MGFSTDKGSSTPGGIMVINSAVRDMYDLFRVTQKGCEIRLYPECTPDGTIMPIRIGPNVQDVTYWVNADHYIIPYLGGGDPSKEKITMLLTIKGDEKIADRKQRRGIRVWDRIRNTFYGRLDNGTAPAHWSTYRSEDRGAIMGTKGKSNAKSVLFARGMVTYYVGSRGPFHKVSRQTPRLRCIFQFSPNAQEALQSLVMERDNNNLSYQGDDYDKMFKYNSSIVDPMTGRLICFGHPNVLSEDGLVQAATGGATQVSIGTSQPAATKANNSDSFAFSAEVLMKDPPNGPGVVPIQQQIIQDCWQHSWDDLLQTYADEAELVRALEVGIPDDLLIESFRDEPELMSERLRNKMNKQDQAAIASTQQVAPQAPPVAAQQPVVQQPVVQQPVVQQPVVQPQVAQPQVVTSPAVNIPESTSTNPPWDTPLPEQQQEQNPPVTSAVPSASGDNAMSALRDAMNTARTAADQNQQ